MPGDGRLLRPGPRTGKVEALRSKAKRLTARGWLIEPAPGRFTLAKDVAGQRGGS